MTTSRRGGFLVPTVATVIGLAILVSLGTWQMNRLAWKEGLIARLNERVAEPARPLPLRTGWSGLEQDRDEFRRVRADVTFLHDRSALVHGLVTEGGVAVAGWFVLTPARTADGGIIIVNRGFVPDAQRDPGSRAAGDIAGPVTIEGVLRWPEPRGMFTPPDDPVRSLWFVRDPQAIAAAKGLEAPPFYIAMTGPVPPGGRPAPQPTRIEVRNTHLGYALTWYGLAFTLLGVYIAFALRRRALAGGADGGLPPAVPSG